MAARTSCVFHQRDRYGFRAPNERLVRSITRKYATKVDNRRMSITAAYCCHSTRTARCRAISRRVPTQSRAPTETGIEPCSASNLHTCKGAARSDGTSEGCDGDRPSLRGQREAFGQNVTEIPDDPSLGISGLVGRRTPRPGVALGGRSLSVQCATHAGARAEAEHRKNEEDTVRPGRRSTCRAARAGGRRSPQTPETKDRAVWTYRRLAKKMHTSIRLVKFMGERGIETIRAALRKWDRLSRN